MLAGDLIGTDAPFCHYCSGVAFQIVALAAFDETNHANRVGTLLLDAGDFTGEALLMTLRTGS
jgi:hypothetical protein